MCLQQVEFCIYHHVNMYYYILYFFFFFCAVLIWITVIMTFSSRGPDNAKFLSGWISVNSTLLILLAVWITEAVRCLLFNVTVMDAAFTEDLILIRCSYSGHKQLLK